MSTIRRTLPLFKSVCKTSSLKSFHTTTRALVAAKPKPKPQRRRVPTTTADKPARSTSSTEDYLPPTVLLSSAHKAGALDIEPEKALNLLRDYFNKAATSSGGFEENLYAEYGIKPATLVMLGQILRRCQGTAQRVLAKRLMISASALGDPVATFGLIESAIRTKSLDAQEDLLGPLRRLGILAKQDRNPEAMALLGKVLLTQGKETEALEWLQKATSHSPDATPAVALNFEGASAALVSLGRLYLNRSDKVAAEEAFRKAAVDLDDPAAYFYLSQLRESGSPEQEVYLLKAASSGIAEAFHNLGALELAKLNVKFDESAPKSISDYGMAREWFQVAATDGFGLSMLNMASICKAVGQDDVALRWLDKAESLPDVKKHAKEMRKMWAIQEPLGK